MRKTTPAMRRVLGLMKSRSRWERLRVILDTGATLDDVREAVETLEDTARTARRVLGGAHPTSTTLCGAGEAPEVQSAASSRVDRCPRTRTGRRRANSTDLLPPAN